ncbi:hypothetical protein VCRA2110O2_30171 [Vibrio crassostreae]|nr:hypothetical protein VCHA44O286_50204 [Vibrio chagasii]CAK2856951.1 hypothetical protein VCRA2110O2_30171 [Vibrio crassostreae]
MYVNHLQIDIYFPNGWSLVLYLTGQDIIRSAYTFNTLRF